MNSESLLAAVILVPVLGSFVLPLLGVLSKSLRNGAAVVIGALTTTCAMLLIPEVIYQPGYEIVVPFGPWMDLSLVVDALSVFVAVVSSFISTLIIIYSVGYIKDYPFQQEYYMLVVLFLGGMMGLVFSANLLLMYLFWEITAICSWRLVGFFRDREIVLKADKTFLMTFAGAVFMLLGFISIYTRTGTFNMVEIRGLTLTGWEVGLITMGIFAKSATLPFHTWLPDAGVAPTPVTALLHAAVLVKIGVYAFARLFNFAFVLPEAWQLGLMWAGLVSALVAACAALMETNIKRLLAYSTVSQIGYIFMGLAVMNEAGMAGALLFILMHGLAKAGLFLSAGVIEHGTGTKDITKLGGLMKVMPLTGVAFLFAVFSIIGIPPLGGFFSKFMVIQGVSAAGHVGLASLAILTAVLTAMYLLRAFTLVFLGDQRDASIHYHREGTSGMVWTVVALAVLSIAAGVFVKYPMVLVNSAVGTILGL